MRERKKNPEINGTRTGYVIRFTCPACTAENIIITKTPRDHYKESRDASCRKCRTRSTILTPYMTHKMDAYNVPADVPGIAP
ncbi:MAG: hypothetical protein WC586_13070 [Methanoregula sp.]